jgi:hypothetical protein
MTIAETAVRLAQSRGPQGPLWEKWAAKWLAGEVAPEKILWPSNTDADEYRRTSPGHESLVSGRWLAWHAWAAARSAYVPAQAQYHLDEALRHAG